MKIRRIEEKCSLCMKCVRDCNAAVWRDIGGVPTPVSPDLCSLCSHCLAVCPESAIEHDGLDAAQIRKIKNDSVDEKVYREIVAGRRSVRHYKNKAVERETIEKIIDLARYSPTASNAQNVEYIVISDKNNIGKISKRIFGAAVWFDNFLSTKKGRAMQKALGKTETMKMLLRYREMFDYYKQQVAEGKDLILHNAPVLILLHAPGSANMAADNCNIAATNIANYAYTTGLGTCFIGFVTAFARFDPGLKKLLHLPKGHRVFATLTIGYPAINHPNTVSRKAAKVNWVE